MFLSISGCPLTAYWRFNGLQVGGGLTFNLGRTQSGGVFTQGNWRLNDLGDIPAALGVRGFVNYKLGAVMLGSSLTKFVADGNSGLLIDATISAQVSQLLGYAADSPISVSDTASTLITTIGYRF